MKRHRQTLRSLQRVNPRMQLRMAPMIDVVFLLLVFFLLAANFRSREGYLPAELPRQVTRALQMEIEPLVIYLNENKGEAGCEMQIGSAKTVFISELGGNKEFARAGKAILTVIRSQGRRLGDPIKLLPARNTHWDYVVKTYDMLWEINARNIIFAMAD